MIRKILKKIEMDRGWNNASGIVYTQNSVAFLDLDDYYAVIDYLDDHNIKYLNDFRSRSKIYLIELVDREY